VGAPGSSGFPATEAATSSIAASAASRPRTWSSRPGTFGRPFTPGFAADLDPEIVQLHSSDYKNPGQLRDGPVLVVGAAHSGADVAIDVAGGHRTILCGRDTGQLPFDIEGRGARVVGWRVMSLLARRVLTTRTPIGR
jgi:putative flavoprotein involved in K+ transport